MKNKLKELVICKADLTSIILNKRNSLDINTLNEVRTKLLLINNLRKNLRENNDIDCQEQITDVKKYILTIK